ncbi:MAG: hypothetical protein AB1896_23205, partial [Thermodesulfobacteriota bacterium]
MPKSKIDPALKAAVLSELTLHVGRARAVGMGELYERAFGRRYSHRINDTRDLRTIIERLRTEGRPIAYADSGYYICQTAGELDEFVRRYTAKALKILAKAAKIKRVSLTDL